MPGSAAGNWIIYEGQKEDGAGDRSRTYDLRITNALLYQLSYTGVRAAILMTNSTACNGRIASSAAGPMRTKVHSHDITRAATNDQSYIPRFSR